MTAEFTRSEYLQRRTRFNRINAVPPEDFFGFYAGQPEGIEKSSNGQWASDGLNQVRVQQAREGRTWASV
jgi:hypothetical protein